MHAPSARLSRAALAIAVAILMSATFPAASRASCYVVNPDGSGDFTTIQAALDAWQNGFGWRDSALVMPGDYPETIEFREWAPYFLVAASGPSATTVNSIATTSDYSTWVVGFTFTHDVLVHCSHSTFMNCVFQGSTNLGGDHPWGTLLDCTFHGRTWFGYVHGEFRRLHFKGAPLHIAYLWDGSFAMNDCTFEGPCDTLVQVPGANSDFVLFTNCRFSNARYGIVYGPAKNTDMMARSCVFEDLSEAGVWMDDSTDWNTVDRNSSLGGADIRDSRFERCGTSAHWTYHRPSAFARGLELVRDTIRASVRDGVEAEPCAGAILYTIIEGSGGNGASFRGNGEGSYEVQPASMYVFVKGSRFSNSGGDGLVVVQSGSSSYWHDGVATVDSCTFAENHGVGLRLDCPGHVVRRSTSFANGGAGLDLHASLPGLGSDVSSNTCVLNRGDGIRLSGPATGGDSLRSVRNNLSSMNAGVGIRVPGASTGSLAFNDAWGNYLAPYAGAWSSADSNLTVDPRFCDPSSGDLGLQQGSPCGVGGVYGLIGAFPESCPNLVAVEPATSPGTAFSVRPSVARGRVEFVPPSSGADGLLELFDIAGRVVWRSPLGPKGGAIRWQGEGPNGRVVAGLYWARFTRGDEIATRRLVWLP